jgi:hypothetical protein
MWDRKMEALIICIFITGNHITITADGEYVSGGDQSKPGCRPGSDVKPDPAPTVLLRSRICWPFGTLLPFFVTLNCFTFASSDNVPRTRLNWASVRPLQAHVSARLWA